MSAMAIFQQLTFCGCIHSAERFGGTPPTFGAVGSDKKTCIFLCQGAQGDSGRDANTTTFQQDGDEQGDKGVWMSVWVDDVDEMHRHCMAAGLEVTFPPPGMPWNVREMHLRHTDWMSSGSVADSSAKIRSQNCQWAISPLPLQFNSVATKCRRSHAASRPSACTAGTYGSVVDGFEVTDSLPIPRP
jgi:hypothetical protein